MIVSRKGLALLAIIVALLALSGCTKPAAPAQQPAQQTPQQPTKPSTPAFAGQYLGQEPPGTTPTMFAYSTIRQAAPEVHSVCQFSPDGHEVYWSTMGGGGPFLYFMKLEDGVWTKPEKVSFTQKNDDSPAFSPDGKRMYFVRLDDRDGPNEKSNIYYVEKVDGAWSKPIRLPDVVNKYGMHWQLSVASNGDLYFGGRESVPSMDRSDIYCAEQVDGQFAKVTKLGSAINNQDEVVLENCPFIARDGSYLLFSRTASTRSQTDLYVSFKNKDGSWGNSIKFDSPVNSSSHEVGPCVTDDGKYMFFTSMRGDSPQVYWVDAKVIEGLRPR